MLVVIAFALYMAIMICLYIVSRKKYQESVERADSKVFAMKPLLHIGLYLLDKIHYAFSNKFDRGLKGRLSELYGSKSAGSMIRLHRANQVGCILLTIAIGLFLGSMTILQYEMEKKPEENVILFDNQISRPAFGSGNKVVEVSADITHGRVTKENSYKLLIQEKPPGSDNEAVATALRRLSNNVIKGQNRDLAHVQKPLYLRTSYEALGNTGVKIDWESGNPDLITIKGDIKSLNDIEKPKEATIKAILCKGQIKKEKIFKLIIIPGPPLSDLESVEKTQDEIAQGIHKINVSNQPGSQINLPKGNGDAKIIWHLDSNKEADLGYREWLNGIGLLIGSVFLILYVLNSELNQKIKMRRRQIQCDLPEFINKMTLLINAGMTVSSAFERIAMEAGRETPLYNELKVTILDIRSGKPEIRAYEDFASRCKVPEASKLVSSLILNIRKGNSELVTILRLLTNEFWETRKNIARRMGEEASTKLLLPMVLMLLAVLVIIMTPAMMSLNTI